MSRGDTLHRVNFLAHSLFGYGNAGLIAGQFCGDFVRGSDLSRFPADIERGIRLHRHLDRFTDTHAALVPARQNMAGVPRRFAGIVVDVMFDHYLATHWSQFSEHSLDAHAQQVIAALVSQEDHLPVSLQRFLGLLQREGILQGNARLANIELTLARIASRSAKLAPIALKEHQLALLHDSLIEPFNRFYPELSDAAVAFLDGSLQAEPMTTGQQDTSVSHNPSNSVATISDKI